VVRRCFVRKVSVETQNDNKKEDDPFEMSGLPDMAHERHVSVKLRAWARRCPSSITSLLEVVIKGATAAHIPYETLSHHHKWPKDARTKTYHI
jgi:hypothetical protein